MPSLRNCELLQRLDAAPGSALYFAAPADARDAVSLRVVLDRATASASLLPVEIALHLLAQVGDAVAYLHALGCVHGDLSPSSVTVSSRGVAKLSHFELARQLEETRTASRAPRVTYAAPELLAGAHADGRADVFSTGVLLYEALTLERPFAGTSARALLASMRGQPPRRPSLVRPGLPDGLDTLVASALALEPSQRPSTPKLVEALHALLPALPPVCARTLARVVATGARDEAPTHKLPEAFFAMPVEARAPAERPRAARAARATVPASPAVDRRRGPTVLLPAAQLKARHGAVASAPAKAGAGSAALFGSVGALVVGAVAAATMVTPADAQPAPAARLRVTAPLAPRAAPPAPVETAGAMLGATPKEAAPQSSLEPAHQLHITASMRGRPVEACVLVNGAYQGAAPVTVERPPGTYRVEVVGGRRALQAEVVVGARRGSTVGFELAQAPRPGSAAKAACARAKR